MGRKYRKQYARMQFHSARRFLDCLSNPSRMLLLSPTNKANALKSLVCLSKYPGIYLQFKEKLKQYDIKWVRPDCFQDFMRIMNNNHSDLLAWYKKVYDMVSDSARAVSQVCGAFWVKNE